MIDFTITLRGSAPLIMHNSRLSNPLDDLVKSMQRITGKQKKTDDDREELARLEHLGSLYYDVDYGPYLPADNIWRSLYDAAKKAKLGPKVKEGVLITSTVNPLVYAGPRATAQLWADKNFVFTVSAKNQMNRVMRTRPIFRQWAVDAQGILDPNLLDWEQLTDIAYTAGSLVGIGDWRPRYGRFHAVVEKR